MKVQLLLGSDEFILASFEASTSIPALRLVVSKVKALWRPGQDGDKVETESDIDTDAPIDIEAYDSGRF